MAREEWILSLSLLVSVAIICIAEEPTCPQFYYQEQLLERMIDVKYKMDAQTQKMEKWEKIVTEKLEKIENDLQENRKLETRLSQIVEMVGNQQAVFNGTIDDLIKQTETLKKTLKDEPKIPVVYFKARSVKDESPSVGDTVVFQTIIQNEGSGYDASTGIFTASVNGTYLFMIQFCLYAREHMALNIVANGAVITATEVGDYNYGHMCSTSDGMATLSSGDEVKVIVTMTDGSKRIHTDDEKRYWSYFSGILLHA